MKAADPFARSKVWVYSLSLAGSAGSNSAGSMGICLASVVHCQVEVSARDGNSSRGVLQSVLCRSVIVNPR